MTTNTQSLSSLASKLGVSELVASELVSMNPNSISPIRGFSGSTLNAIKTTPDNIMQKVKSLSPSEYTNITGPFALSPTFLADFKERAIAMSINTITADINATLALPAGDLDLIVKGVTSEITSSIEGMFANPASLFSPNFSMVDSITSIADTAISASIGSLQNLSSSISSMAYSTVGFFENTFTGALNLLNNSPSQMLSSVIGSVFGSVFGPLSIIPALKQQYWNSMSSIMATSDFGGKFFFDSVSKFPQELGKGFGDTRVGALPGSRFQRPNPKYPLLPSESDIHRVSRGDDTVYEPGGMKYNYDQRRDPLLNDPEMHYRAVYPYNHYHETESGHVMEWDDTAGHERIQYKHRSGTGMHVNPDGDQKVVVQGSNFTVIIVDNKVHIHGDAETYIDGTCKISVNGDAKINVGMNVELSSNGGIEVNAQEDFVVNAKNIRFNARTPEDNANKDKLGGLFSVKSSYNDVNAFPLEMTELGPGGIIMHNSIYASKTKPKVPDAPWTEENHPMVPATSVSFDMDNEADEEMSGAPSSNNSNIG